MKTAQDEYRQWGGTGCFIIKARSDCTKVK